MKKKEISVVIPVYNASLNLKNLVDDLSDVLKKNFSSYELILVNDKSLDDSWNIIKNLCQSFEVYVLGLITRKGIVSFFFLLNIHISFS